MSAEAMPRIHGTEMEWCIRYLPFPDDSNPNPVFKRMDSHDITPVVINYLLPHIPRLGASLNNSFLSNGSRLYMDTGEHLESSTAEDTSFMGTVANELASERMLFGAFERAREARILRDFVINKRIVDDNGATWGYHESYCAPVEKIQINSTSLALLGIHLATRNVFFGAGRLDLSGRFHISQKAAEAGSDFDQAATSSKKTKPVVNLRNEPHADKEHWVRVHVTSGDPNMSPWATYMKLATTSLVLRLMENGHDMPWLRFKYQLFRAAQLVSKDTTLKKPLALQNGKTIRPVEVQEELANEARLLSKKIELPDEELMAIDEWSRASEEAGKDPLLIGDRSDWVAKQAALQRYQENHDIAWDSGDMRAKDRQWDALGPAGVGWAMRQKAWKAWMPDEELIGDRMQYPPESTRAFVRGTFVRTFAGQPGANADWTTARVNNKTFFMHQPDGSDAERIWSRIADEVKSKAKSQN